LRQATYASDMAAITQMKQITNIINIKWN